MQTTLALTTLDRFGVKNSLLTNVVLAFAGSWLVALLAQVSIPVPFSPVPITGQTLGVLLVGAALGSRRGLASLGLYVGQGSMGLPFFAGGSAGFGVLLGPTGGYILGFILAAHLVGWLSERGLDKQWSTAWIAFLAGHLAVFGCGLLWLSQFIGFEAALVAGLYPFIPGAFIKTVVAAGLLPTAWKIVGRNRA